MQSGCPHRKGGMYRSFHGHVLKSPQNKSDLAVPVVHPADGKQTNMVANPYPGQLRVANCPDQRQQGYAQIQHFYGLHHRQTSQACIQNPQPRDHACAPQHRHHLNSRSGVQHSKCSDTSANKNSQPATAGTTSSALDGYIMGQKRCSSEHQGKNPLLYALLKNDSPDLSSKQNIVKGQSSSLQKTAYIEHKGHNRLQVRSSPAGLIREQPRMQKMDHKGEPPTDDQIREYINRMIASCSTFPSQQRRCNEDLNSCTNDSSVRSNSVAHLPTASGFDQRRMEWQRGNLTVMEQYTVAGGQALNPNSAPSPKSNEAGDGTTVPSKKSPTGTPAPHLEHSNNAPKNESVKESGYVDLDLPVKKHLDVTMLTNADGKLVYSDDCGDKTFVGSSDENVHSKLYDKYIENGMATLHYSLTALKELIASLDKVENVAKEDNVSEVILQQYWNGDIGNVHLFTSTEYPQIMVNVATTCTKNEDESPVVLTAMSGVTLNEPSEKDPISLISCNSSQEFKSSWLNVNKNLDDIDKIPGVCWALKSINVQGKKERSPKPKDTVILDNVQRVTELPLVSEEFQGSSGSVPPENTLNLRSLVNNQNVNTKKEQDVEDVQQCPVTCREEISNSSTNVSVWILKTLSLPASQNEQLFEDGSVHSEHGLKGALIEDKVTEPPSFSENKTEEAHKDPQYEDISDDEGISQLLTKFPNSEKEEVKVLPQFEDTQYEDISDDDDPQIESSAVETPFTQVPENKNDLSSLENKSCGHVMGQTEGLSNEKVIPVKQFLPEVGAVTVDQHCFCSCFVEPNEHLSCPKCCGERDLGWQTNHPVSCSPYSVFRDETDDQMDDDDWLVVPISIADLTFVPEDETQDDLEVGLQQHCETELLGDSNPKPCRSLQPQPPSVPFQIEVFDTIESFRQAKVTQFGTISVTEKCTEVAQNAAGFCSEPEDSSDTDDSCDYSTGSEHNYLTVTRHLLEKTSAPLSPETSAYVFETTNDYKGQPRSSRLQRLKELMEAKARFKHVQPKTKRQISKNENVIILSSDSEDEGNKTCKGKKERNTHPSANSPKPDDSQFEECTSSDLPHTSERLSERVEHVTIRPNIPTKESVIIIDSNTEDEWEQKDERSDISDSVDLSNTSKSGELVEYEASRQTTSNTGFCDPDQVVKKHRRHKRRRSSDSSSAIFAVQNGNSPKTVNSPTGTANGKPEKPRSSSKESPLLFPQSADSSSILNPVIPRLLVQNASPPGTYLKLAKEFKGRPDKDETRAVKTPTSASKKAVSRNIHRNKERGDAKSNSGNDQCAVNNKVQGRVPKARLVYSDKGSSTSSLTSTNGQPPEVRQSSPSSRGLSQSVESHASARPSMSVPRSPSSTRPNYSNASTLDHPCSPAKDPPLSAAIPLAKQQVIRDWSESHVPIRKDRKRSLRMEEHLKMGSSDSSRKPGPGPSHRERHVSKEAVTPLMKRSKLEAIKLTRDMKRDTPRDQRSSVGTGYKWLETPTVARPTKVGSDRKRKRCRASPRTHQ